MSLDSNTLYVIASGIATILGLGVLRRERQKNKPTFKWCGSAYLLGQASLAIPILACGSLGEMLSVTANAIGFMAFGTVWRASRVLNGRAHDLSGLFLGSIVWIAAAAALKSEASAIQLTTGTGIVAIYAALTATQLCLAGQRRLQRGRSETDWSGVGAIVEAIERALRAAEQDRAELSRHVEGVLARAAVTIGNGTDEYLDRDPLDSHHQNLFGIELADGERCIREFDLTITDLKSLRETALILLQDRPSPAPGRRVRVRKPWQFSQRQSHR